MRITFLGGAGTVTGSCHALEVGGRVVLLDCGQFQGMRAVEARNREPLPFAARDVDAVVLSHAHVDHSGRLPMLRRQGFSGPIYTHPASRALCEIMLKDAGYLQEKDAQWENLRRRRRGWPPLEPLYTQADGEAVMSQFRGLEYGERREIVPGVTACLHDAGHILGAAIVAVDLEERGKRVRLVFSGDLGVPDAPLMHAPAIVPEADLVLLESTYGARNHRSSEATLAELGSIFLEAARDGGNVVIPAFAVGRTQDLLHLLALHYDAWQIGRWRVFLDSPMAIDATAVYASHPGLCRLTPRAPPNFTIARTTEESMQINAIERGAIIIAGSGMCTGGRIRHHLKHNLWREECHVVMIGFQAEGTLGRRLVEGVPQVRLWNDAIRVAARVHTIGGLSAHAGQADLLRWYGNFRSRPPVCLVHGEAQALHGLADALERDFGLRARIPAIGESIELG